MEAPDKVSAAIERLEHMSGPYRGVGVDIRIVCDAARKAIGQKTEIERKLEEKKNESNP